jgi:hypothetical protein
MSWYDKPCCKNCEHESRDFKSSDCFKCIKEIPKYKYFEIKHNIKRY